MGNCWMIWVGRCLFVWAVQCLFVWVVQCLLVRGGPSRPCGNKVLSVLVSSLIRW